MISQDVLIRIRSYLNGFTDIPETEWEQFKKLLVLEKFSNGDRFVTAGEVTQQLGFVVQGLFRISYLTSKGNQFHRGFCAEGSFLSAYSSVLSGRPSDVEIVAMEHSSVLAFGFGAFQLLYSRHPCWQELGRKHAERTLISRDRREFQMLALDAAARYEEFLQDCGSIRARLSQRDIAGYIGVTPESLSRILRRS